MGSGRGGSLCLRQREHGHYDAMKDQRTCLEELHLSVIVIVDEDGSLIGYYVPHRTSVVENIATCRLVTFEMEATCGLLFL